MASLHITAHKISSITRLSLQFAVCNLNAKKNTETECLQQCWRSSSDTLIRMAILLYGWSTVKGNESDDRTDTHWWSQSRHYQIPIMSLFTMWMRSRFDFHWVLAVGNKHMSKPHSCAMAPVRVPVRKVCVCLFTCLLVSGISGLSVSGILLATIRRVWPVRDPELQALRAW